MKDAPALRRAPLAVRPAEPERLTRDELRRLAKSERKLASAEPSVAAAGRREIVELERRRRTRRDDADLAARLAETAALGLARGEEVKAESVRIAAPALDEHGARLVSRGLPLYRRESVARLRIVSRGGLQLAFERGDLDGGRVRAERLYETGKAYRWAFEASTGLTTAERNLAAVSAHAPLRASAGPQDAVFAAGEALRAYRRGLADRPQAVLDRICGVDMTVRATAIALAADPRTIRRLLVEALTAASDNAPRRRHRDDQASGA